ncbi:unnamed protein product [Ixodes pacificus]
MLRHAESLHGDAGTIQVCTVVTRTQNADFKLNGAYCPPSQKTPRKSSFQA